MTGIIKENGTRRFVGMFTVDSSLRETEALAGCCLAYTPDDDDEMCIEGTITCFNCRYRRWLRDGFSCARDFPTARETR